MSLQHRPVVAADAFVLIVVCWRILVIIRRRSRLIVISFIRIIVLLFLQLQAVNVRTTNFGVTSFRVIDLIGWEKKNAIS